VTSDAIANDAYTELAARYDKRIDTKAHNAYYERPATLALLGRVAGLRVLDAGAGRGLSAADGPRAAPAGHVQSR